jgi:16S rRNA (guanine966-N2)-methyltransferase
MRVIAGDAGGVPLVASVGAGVRPTSDRLKSAMFAVLGEAGCEGQVLDLFAGSGALGIEALSRGAERCDFVESRGAACAAIRLNLQKTKLTARARVYCQTVERYFTGPAAAAAGPYRLILMDPPYAWPDLDSLLRTIGASPVVAADTVLMLEHSSRREVPPLAGRLELSRTRAHGDGAFSLYRLSPRASGLPAGHAAPRADGGSSAPPDTPPGPRPGVPRRGNDAAVPEG